MIHLRQTLRIVLETHASLPSSSFFCIGIVPALIFSVVLGLPPLTLFAQEPTANPLEKRRMRGSDMSTKQVAASTQLSLDDSPILGRQNGKRKPPSPVIPVEDVNNSANVIAVIEITVQDNDVDRTSREHTELPEELSLLGSYPNPFRIETKISFDLPERAQVYAEVFDLLGRVVYTSPTYPMDAGWNRTLPLTLPQTSSGFYIYRIIVETASITLLKTGHVIQIQ